MYKILYYKHNTIISEKKGFFQMANNELENTFSVSSLQSVKTQTDMTHWKISDLAYDDLTVLTEGGITNPEEINSGNYYTFEIEKTPAETEEWELVKALDDEETDTQALTFKKDDEIVISYRGSQEAQDWFDTDPDYLVMGGNKEPSKTRANKERLSDPANIKGTLSISRDNTEEYEQMDLENPFDVATDFAEEVKAEFPDAEINTTGHSLGGALATYVSVMASQGGEPFVRQTITYAAPNVYGMLPEEVQEQANQGDFRHNTINYTDSSDTFGTLNDQYPQVGEQVYVDNQKLWMGNHSLENFEHLFVADGVIQLTPDSMKELASQSEDISAKIKKAYLIIDEFEEEHDEKIKEIQHHFEDQIASTYDKLEISDVKMIIDKYAKEISGGTPKFYSTVIETELLASLEKLFKDSKEIKENLNEMAEEFEHKDEIVANWLEF